MKGRSKISRYGWVFGRVLTYVSVITMLITMLFLVTSDDDVNIKGILVILMAFIVYRYGVWRSGYDD